MKLTTVILVFLLVSTAWAVDKQERNADMERVLTEKSPTRCADYYYNATLLVPRLYREHKLDSINLVLDYWEKQCGANSRITRVRILTSIDAESFSEELYDSTIIYDLISFRRAREWINKYGYSDWGRGDSRSESVLAQQDFDRFTTSLADSLTLRTDSTSLSHFFALYFSDQFDTALALLQNNLGTSQLRESYDLYVYRLKRMEHEGTNYAVWSGAWLPRGNNEVLGNHPELGFAYGKEYGFGSLDMIMAVRVGKSKNEYVVKSEGDLVTTRDHVGLYVGAEYGYPVLFTSRISTDLQVGLGVDGILSVNESDDKPKELDAFALSAGIRQRIYFGRYRTWYCGLQARYYYPFRDNKDGTSLKGGAIGLSFLIGRVQRGYQTELLKILGQ
jgi:hypothetical protein